ncbi:MAG: Hsp70 family protein [Chloroflexi bacterium]|nr:Hsp70 family protein [Chloroflexota bacterium]
MALTKFIGLDLGNTYARLAYTSGMAGIQKPEDLTPPQLQVFGVHSRTYVESIARIDTMPPQTVDSEEVIRLIEATSDILLCDRPMLGVEQHDLNSQRSITAIGATLAERLRTHFRVVGKLSNAFQISAGIPANWPANSQEAQLLAASLSSGFGQVMLYPDALAAVLCMLYKENIQLLDQSQSWLVMDVGGATTRLTMVHKPLGDANLEIKKSLSLVWGGNHLDEQLYRDWWLPAYWKDANEPDPNRRKAILLLLKELKESLSKTRNTVHSDFHRLGLEEPIQLSTQIFEGVCRPAIQEFYALLESNPVIELEKEPIERVVLIGGSAHWPFVLEATQQKWGRDKVFLPDQPDLAVVFGLSLAQSGFKPPLTRVSESAVKIENTTDIGTVPSKEDGKPPPLLPPPVPPETLRQDRRAKARKTIRLMVLIGVGVALALVWLPFGSWPFLMAIEVYMMLEIAKSYGYKYTDGLIILLVIGLLALSIGLSTALAPFTETLFCLVKPVIAGLVIWGMGEGTIAILDWDSTRQH